MNIQGGDRQEEVIAGTTPKKYAPPRANLIFAVVLVATFFGGMGYLALYQPKKEPIVQLAGIPKPEKVAGETITANADVPNQVTPNKQDATPQERDLAGVRNIEISNLNAVVEGKGKNATVRVRLKLINHGDPNTPYPDLRLKWPGSTAKDIVIASTQYAHPNGPFTELEIETELRKPPHAKGVDIHLNESN